MWKRLALAGCAVILAAMLAWAYPAAELTIPPSTLKFSHRLHVTDNEIECVTCHASVEQSKKASDRLLPTMDVCSGCHDVEDDAQCGMCHENPDEPEAAANPERPIEFDHAGHLSRGATCAVCHGDIGSRDRATGANMPKMAICLECHDGEKADAACQVCHRGRISLSDIHPAEWLHTHGDRAAQEPQWCDGCHKEERDCLDCHRGDNVTGSIHDLNYVYTHGLDANSKERDCARCHDRQAFCVACHEAENRIPWLHSTLAWRTEHGRTARRDPENCASCHETDDPTCARVGCHNDSDGLRGTDPPIHSGSAALFDGHGPWHDDDGFYCFQCHVSTGQPGQGFCGYCHGSK